MTISRETCVQGSGYKDVHGGVGGGETFVFRRIFLTNAKSKQLSNLYLQPSYIGVIVRVIQPLKEFRTIAGEHFFFFNHSWIVNILYFHGQKLECNPTVRMVNIITCLRRLLSEIIFAQERANNLSVEDNTFIFYKIIFKGNSHAVSDGTRIIRTTLGTRVGRIQN